MVVAFTQGDTMMRLSRAWPRHAVTTGVCTALIVLVSCVVPAGAQVRSVGEVTFSQPAGFRYQRIPPPNDGAEMDLSGPNWYCRIVVLPAFRSGRDIDSDLTAAWQRHVPKTFGRAPAINDRFDYLEAGYPGRFAAAANAGAAALYVLRAHGATVPVIVLTNREAIRFNLSVVIELFLDGIRITPDRAQPLKQIVQLADLEGEWHEGNDSSVRWVDVYGNSAGSTFVAHGVTYDIAGNGTFRSRFAGISSTTIVRGSTNGRVDLQGDRLALREAGSQTATRYRIISYQEAPNGVTVLTLLGVQYENTVSNVRANGERWYRRPIKRE